MQSPINQKFPSYTILAFEQSLTLEKTALFTAVELENEKIVELLLSNQKQTLIQN